MKHSEVRVLLIELKRLINHLVEKKVSVFHVNWGLDKNLTILTKADEEIDRNISKELRDIEINIFELAKKVSPENPSFQAGLAMLSPEDIAKREELVAEYHAAMEEESDVKLYYLNPDKIEGTNIEWEYLQILKKFLPNE